MKSLTYEETYGSEGARILLDLTVEEAQLIRTWRVDQGATWRGVAHAWYAERTEARLDQAWQGSQILGEDLCESAAKLLGEDDTTEPWN